MLVDFEG